jgi:hypothetical protein
MARSTVSDEDPFESEHEVEEGSGCQHEPLQPLIPNLEGATPAVHPLPQRKEEPTAPGAPRKRQPPLPPIIAPEAPEAPACASKCRERLGEAAAATLFSGPPSSSSGAEEVPPVPELNSAPFSESEHQDGRHVRVRDRSGTRKRLDERLEDARQACEREQIEGRARVSEIECRLKRMRVTDS